jgi:hypothetical protein
MRTADCSACGTPRCISCVVEKVKGKLYSGLPPHIGHSGTLDNDPIVDDEPIEDDDAAPYATHK